MQSAEFTTLLNKALSPTQLAGLPMRNRVIKTATFEGMCPAGIPSQQLLDHHQGIAAGGTALTTVAYCGVSPDGLTFPDQMVMQEAIFPKLKALADAVHQEGGAVSGQMAHCGFFSRNKPKHYPRPKGPSWVINHYGLFDGLPLGGRMNEADIDKTVREYSDAAAFLQRAGFDAVEIHMGHGYLLSQFISPATNRRNDQYGGSLANRMRFPLKVLTAVKERVGKDFPVLVKSNLDDGFRGGLKIEESVDVARMLEKNGADAIVLTGGFTSRSPMFLFRGDSPLPDMLKYESNLPMKLALRVFGGTMFKSMPYQELYFLDLAKQIRDAVTMPLVYLGGVSTAESIVQAMAAGFDFVAMGRALIRDPQMVNRVGKDAAYLNRCNHCNRCVPQMNTPTGIKCMLEEAGWRSGHPAVFLPPESRSDSL